MYFCVFLFPIKAQVCANRLLVLCLVLASSVAFCLHGVVSVSAVLVEMSKSIDVLFKEHCHVVLSFSVLSETGLRKWLLSLSPAPSFSVCLYFLVLLVWCSSQIAAGIQGNCNLEVSIVQVPLSKTLRVVSKGF